MEGYRTDKRRMEGCRTDIKKLREEWKVAGRIKKVERRMEGCRTDKL